MSLTDHHHGLAPDAPPGSLRSDLRLPLLAGTFLAVGISGISGLPLALAALAGAVALAAAARVHRREALKRAAHVEGFLVVLLLFLPFSLPGTEIFRLGPFSASAEGLARAVLIAVKVNAAALVMLALFGHARPERLGSALAALGAPRRLVLMLEMILRHSHTARDGLARQHEAMRARGFAHGTGLHAWRTYGHLFGGALLRAFHRAERVEEAMRMRGGRPAPAPLPPMARRDRLTCLAAGALALALVAADRLLP